MAEGGDMEMDVFDRGEREEDIPEDDFDTSPILEEDIDTGLYREEVDIDEHDNVLRNRRVPVGKRLAQLSLELKKGKSKRFLQSY